MTFAVVLLAMTAGVSPAEIFPMSVNSTWLYQRQSSLTTKPIGYAVTVTKKVTTAEGTAWAMGTSDARSGETALYRVDDKGVYIISAGSPLQSIKPPQPILVAPLTPGKSWKWSGSLASQNGLTPGRVESKVLPPERLIVLGKETECVKVETKMWIRIGKRDIKLTRTSWYAPGIGLAQEQTTYASDKDQVTSVDTLSAYSAGTDK